MINMNGKPMKVFNEKEYLYGLRGKDRLDKIIQVKLVKEFWDDDLEFCSCGAPWDSLNMIKKILNLVYKYFDEKDEDIDFRKEVQNIIGCRDDNTSMVVYEMLVNVFNNAGIMEHGSNITWSWLTSYGEALRDALNELSDFELENLWTIYSLFKEISQK